MPGIEPHVFERDTDTDGLGAGAQIASEKTRSPQDDSTIMGRLNLVFGLQ